MPQRYLLDTDIASYIIKDSPPRVRERLRQVPFQEVGISVVTEAELRFGVARNAAATRLSYVVEDFLTRVEILPWDSGSARTYASLRASMEREGALIGSMDMLIAAHALALGCILVTHDKAFAKVKGLKTMDWTR